MNTNIQTLKAQADTAKYLYNIGEVEYEKMVETVKAYIDASNVEAKRIAKEYGMRPQTMKVSSYIR